MLVERWRRCCLAADDGGEFTGRWRWQAILLIAGMYSVSLAMVNTGLAALIGEAVVRVVAPLGPLGLAAGVYLLTAALTQ
jgi:di/tricarboxylate transporter